MIWTDFVIIGVVILSSSISLTRGFTKEAISLVVWFAAFFVAQQFYQDLAVFLTDIQDQLVRNGVAIGILFVATLILGGLVNYIIAQLVEVTGLSGTDRVLGAVFGALRGILIVCAVLFFMDVFTPASQAQWWRDSVLIPEFRIVVEWFFEFLKNNSSLLNSASR